MVHQLTAVPVPLQDNPEKYSMAQAEFQSVISECKQPKIA
jgi:hypothetical protein